MMSDARVMLAVPTFRAAALIGPTIASALAQTHERLQIVVIDNCSDDNTVAIVEEAAQRHHCGDRLGVIRHDTNVGRIANWNRCLDLFAASNDDYLKFLFAGDRLHPECIAELAHAATASRAVLASSAYEIVADDSAQTAAHLDGDRVLSPAEALTESVRHGNWFGAPSALLVSHSAAEGLRFSDDFGWAGDWKFCLDVCMQGPSVWRKRTLATVDLASRRFYQERATRFASRLEDAWMRYYALERLRQIDPAPAAGDDLERELEQSVKQTLMNRRDLIDVTAAKFVHRLQEAMR
ncbi:MAG TPA: glycosyltransferase family 2 protein [Acidobacteriota bacterium]|nr:glycosyltransferase family 2 protein [Acidobacteriota bacterium]